MRTRTIFDIRFNLHRPIGSRSKFCRIVRRPSGWYLQTIGEHGYIDIGGMFTVLKIRENLTSYDDPGWHPGAAVSLSGRIW